MTRRRDFLKSVGAAVLGAAFAVPRATVTRRGGPDVGPVSDLVQQFRRRARGETLEHPTGLTREDYLDVVEGVGRFFRNFQNGKGAIIDPYTEGERQYSTPAYALCGAVLCHARPELRARFAESSAKATDWALRTLVDGEAADNHGDFFTVKLMQALPLLRSLVSKERYSGWEELLRRLDPERSYRDILSRKEVPERIHNWNLVAVSGEFLRSKMGYGDGRFVDQYLPLQVTRFTAHGMYVDPHNPLAYDVFSRYHVALMLANGYRGALQAELANAHLRGGWTALHLQSPAGEVPCGGRSAHHQWNEAAQAATFEILASRLWAEGDRVGARAFKRGARLCLQSVRRWVRPSGELWIVKNRFEPSTRWGFEGYSFHSQYNLLAASMLAVAYLHANEEIPEGPAPADVGGYVLTLDDGARDDFPAPGFNKTVANTSGLYLLLEHAADHGYNPTGLLRVHGPDLRGVSDGSVNTAHYRKRGWSQDSDGPGTAAIGPHWRDWGGRVRSLAWYGYGEIGSRWKVRVVEASPGGVRFLATYRLPEEVGLEREFVLQNGAVQVTERLIEGTGTIGATWPVWLFDGKNRASVDVADNEVTFQIGGAEQVYRLLGPTSGAVRLQEGEWPFRNGLLAVAEAWSNTREIGYEIRLRRAA